MARKHPAATDIESLRYPSWCLCRLLDTIIDTKEVIALRRKDSAIITYVNDVNAPYKLLYSGSRGEGFNFRSSDSDWMCIIKGTVALEVMHITRPVDDIKTLLLMRREGCNPGFVILQLLNETNDYAIIDTVAEYHGHPVVSSLLYRDVHRNAERGEVGHGPCNTFHALTDVDVAVSFECDVWPTEANEFVCRQRCHGWPHKSLLDKIICRGCHVVPIGDKESDLFPIQWRLSFSAAEKDLLHSFNHTQFLVYGLLKIFLKQFINKYQSIANILCSYFLKTAMFFSIESTPPSFWREDLLLPCFWFCLNKLIRWVEQGYCPNYFVPQNNMFRGKVFGENQSNLLTILNQCKRCGWRCIYLCEDLRSLQNYVNHPESLYRNNVIPSENQRESDLDSIVCDTLFAISSHEIRRRLVRTLMLLRYAKTQHEEDISILQLYGALRDTGLNACINVGINNKDKYRKSYHMLLASVKSNIYTGYVYLATFYYISGQYKKALYLCNRIISQWKPYVMYHSSGHRTTYNKDTYQRYVCGRGVGVLDKAKLAYASDISIRPATKYFYPVELHHDIEATAPFFVCMPPIPYTAFLSFLCHHKLGNIDDSVSALHDLHVLIQDEQQGCEQYVIVLNMLAICQDKLGDVNGAIDTCLLSRSFKPEKNGAEQILQRLLRECS